ncbi:MULTISPECIES: class I SAM-dependent methyltransferase [Xenorhabdus]|uniref:class I SAM-dependent methyltransferase n=1 Tax=Xenorhabdus TaxID=626 RepID=UPI0006466AAB|nr:MULTISPECIES: class I SAM-dependent methyltransferase [Xenorhabdus]
MEEQITTHEAGHKFLARLGKKRLRPGGKKATEWLLTHSTLVEDSAVLEIACNMGTTAIDIAERFHCHIVGIDMDKDALAKAGKHIAEKGLSHLITIRLADASRLPFDDNSFDVVINEAMLTMYSNKAKACLLQEYLRVLKPGGRLLTHDIALRNQQDKTVTLTQMHQAIHVKAQPMLKEEWINLFKNAGFSKVSVNCGPMTLLSPQGLIYDEGFIGALTIVKNALKKENWPQFLCMFRYFRRNRKKLNYIATVSIK